MMVLNVCLTEAETLCAPAQELDTTLQVLGIDGMAQQPKLRVTLSPHVPAVAAGVPGGTTVQRSASIASSGMYSPRHIGRTTSEAGFRW
jgi:hypothetical protein